MNKEEILKAIMELPKGKANNSISTMNSINVNDLMSAVDRLDKVQTYDELLKENKLLIERIDDSIDYLNNNICYVGKKITIKPYTDLKDLLEILKGNNNE